MVQNPSSWRFYNMGVGSSVEGYFISSYPLLGSYRMINVSCGRLFLFPSLKRQPPGQSLVRLLDVLISIVN